MSKKTDLNIKKSNEEILNLKKTIMNLNFQKSSGQLEKTSKIKEARKQLARLKTNISISKGKSNA